MGSILNPNNEDFKNLVSIKSNLYIDKTDFIYETIKRINSEGKYICFTRPRRFGKTITAKMLSAYYSKGCNSRELFDNLKIAQEPSYITHLNQYNVIYIDMNEIQGLFNVYQRKQNKVTSVIDFVDFLEYQIIKELKDCDEYQKTLKTNEIENIGVFEALRIINIKQNEKFIFIIDEWDLIYREYKNDTELQEKYISLLRDLFKSSAGQKFSSLAYLTGILPIKKYISQSALNNFDEYNMLNPNQYECFFGFTEEEVGKLAEEHHMDFFDLKRWYDGYKLNGTSILNPNSVINAIKRNCIKSYWSDTSAIDSVKELLKYNFADLKSEFLEMINTSKDVTFDPTSFQNDMVSIERKDDVYSLLVCLGYLACINHPNATTIKIAYIPNEEIRLALRNMVIGENWFPQMQAVKRSKELLDATFNLKAEKIAKIIEEIHNSEYISLDTYNNEASMHFCISHGYFWSTLNIYQMAREVKSGTGYADIVYTPLDRISNLPIIIIELKYGKNPQEALTQIKQREYYKNYQSKYKRIILVGINYDKSTKKHDCIIEEIKN